MMQQEREGLRAKPVVIVIVGALLITAACVAIAGLLLSGQRGNITDHAAPELPAHPAPIGSIERSLTATTARGEEKAQRARSRLRSYCYLGPDQKRAHIPIERAFDMMVADAGAAP